MLPKKNRLSRKEILGFLPRAKSFQGKFLSLHFIPLKDNLFKAGVSVSKKVAKSAVKRNSVRRRIYRALVPHQNRISKATFLFVVKNFDNSNSLTEEAVSLLKKANLLKD